MWRLRPAEGSRARRAAYGVRVMARREVTRAEVTGEVTREGGHAGGREGGRRGSTRILEITGSHLWPGAITGLAELVAKAHDARAYGVDAVHIA